MKTTTNPQDQFLAELAGLDYVADRVMDIALDAVDRPRPYHPDVVAQTLKAEIVKAIDDLPYDAWMRLARQEMTEAGEVRDAETTTSPAPVAEIDEIAPGAASMTPDAAIRDYVQGLGQGDVAMTAVELCAAIRKVLQAHPAVGTVISTHSSREAVTMDVLEKRDDDRNVKIAWIEVKATGEVEALPVGDAAGYPGDRCDLCREEVPILGPHICSVDSKAHHVLADSAV